MQTFQDEMHSGPQFPLDLICQLKHDGHCALLSSPFLLYPLQPFRRLVAREETKTKRRRDIKTPVVIAQLSQSIPPLLVIHHLPEDLDSLKLKVPHTFGNHAALPRLHYVYRIESE